MKIINFKKKSRDIGLLLIFNIVILINIFRLVLFLIEIHNNYNNNLVHYKIEDEIFYVYNNDNTIKTKLENVAHIIKNSDKMPDKLYIFTDDIYDNEKALYQYSIKGNVLTELCKKKDVYNIMLSTDYNDIYYLKKNIYNVHLDKYISVEGIKKYPKIIPSIFDEKYKQDGYKTNFQLFSDDYYYYLDCADKVDAVKKILNDYCYYFKNGYDIVLFDLYHKSEGKDEIILKDILYKESFNNYLINISSFRKFDVKNKTKIVDKMFYNGYNRSHYDYVNINNDNYIYKNSIDGFDYTNKGFSLEPLELVGWDGHASYPDGFIELADYYGIDIDTDSQELDHKSSLSNWLNYIKISEIKELDYRFSLDIKSEKESTLFMYYPKLIFDSDDYLNNIKDIDSDMIENNMDNIANITNMINDLNVILDKNRKDIFKEVVSNEMDYIDVKNYVYLTDISVYSIDNNTINIKYCGILESDDVIESVKQIPIAFMFSYNFDTKEIKFEKTDF